MKILIKNKIDSLSNLISPRKDKNRPIYNWHSFKHSYSKELVDKLISEFEIQKGDFVLDPFCGGGTTLLACKEAGINSTGYDILPFSVLLSNVKTRNYNVKDLVAEKNKLNINRKTSFNIPALTNIPIAKKAFSSEVRAELIKIKCRVNEIKNDNIRDLFNLGLLSILESVSNTSKSGGFLRIVQKKIKPEDICNTFRKKIESMISDVEIFNRTFKEKNISVFAEQSDARRLNIQQKFDAIITSPPYPNRHDYSRIYSLEMLFDFVTNNDELKNIRYETLRSHVEARKKYESIGYVKPKSLIKLIKEIKNRGVNNPQITEMLEGYFEDMYLALKEMQTILKNKGKIALVISNVRFSGVNIPVDEILYEIGMQVGLKAKAIWVIRYRGNSSQQMKLYKREPSRESIVVWEN